jgi:hypothetical protein
MNAQVQLDIALLGKHLNSAPAYMLSGIHPHLTNDKLAPVDLEIATPRGGVEDDATMVMIGTPPAVGSRADQGCSGGPATPPTQLISDQLHQLRLEEPQECESRRDKRMSQSPSRARDSNTSSPKAVPHGAKGEKTDEDMEKDLDDLLAGVGVSQQGNVLPAASQTGRQRMQPQHSRPGGLHDRQPRRSLHSRPATKTSKAELEDWLDM